MSYVDRILSAIAESAERRYRTVYLDDIELTQSTQYFGHHGSIPGGRMQVDGHYKVDNLISLYEGKATLVRAYFASSGGWTGKVTGYLRVKGTSKKYMPLPPRTEVTWPNAYDPILQTREWGSTASSLNFLLPADRCYGGLELEVVYWEPVDPFVVRVYEPGTFHLQTWSRTEYASFQPSKKPILRVVAVEITGTSAGAQRPTVSGTLDAIVPSTSMYPISGFEFAPCGSISFPAMTDASQGKQTLLDRGWWDRLVIAIEMQGLASFPVDLYVGVLPFNSAWPVLNGAVPAAGGITGNLSPPRLVSFERHPRMMAHEIGHAFGLGHAPSPPIAGLCAPQADVEPYPNYQGYLTGSIGEYGFDVPNLRPFSPASFYDVMTSCNTPMSKVSGVIDECWISPENYRRVAQRLYPAVEFTPNIWMPKVKSVVIGMSGLEEGRLQIHSLYVVEGAQLRATQRCEDLALRAVDAEGTTLAVGRAQRIDANCGCGCGDRPLYNGSCPWPAGAVALEVSRQGAVLEQIKPEPGTLKPRLEIKRSAGRRNLMRLSWQCRGAVDAMIRYSEDGGERWTAIHAGPAEGSRVFNLDELPGGSRCVFEVVASTGMKSGVLRSKAFSVPRKPRTARFHVPESEDLTGILRGGCWSPDFGLADARETVWYRDGKEEIGRGFELHTMDLEPGVHRIKLCAPDGMKGTASGAMQIEVRVDKEGRRRVGARSGRKTR